MTTLFFTLSADFKSYSQQVTLYDNHFESPNIPPVPNCGPDLDATDLNTLWSGTAGGTGGGGSFQQVNTVETILITGPNEQYSDPSGIGGDYCISMLSTAQDDKASVTLNSQMLPFCIISFDISAIDLPSCGGPFGVDTPVMNIKIYDSLDGVFNINSPGTLLDEDTITGTAPGTTSYTFNWVSRLASMDIDEATDGNITVVFDLWRSGYAAIDNLLIVSSLTGIGTPAPENEFSLMPIPAHDEVMVHGLNFPSATIMITDLCGRVMKTVECFNEKAFDISDLPAGNYVVTILGKEFMVAKKLIVM